MTRDAIKVVIVAAADPNTVPSDLATAFSGGTNQATGQTGTFADAVQYQLDMLPNLYETYGRELDVEFYVRTGIDEASQRADALADRGEEAVRGAGGATDHGAAARGSQDRLVRHPERPRGGRSPGAVPVVVDAPTASRSSLLAAEVLGKQVWDGKAEWAGDESMQTKTRKFGLVHPGRERRRPLPRRRAVRDRR